MEDVAGALPRPSKHAYVELGHGVELELERGHDAEVSATSSQGPEQFGVVLEVGAHELTVGGDHLRRDHAVAGQAVLARKPAVSATQGVAHDPDLGRGAG